MIFFRKPVPTFRDHALDRHSYRLKGAVAIDEIDPLLDDAKSFSDKAKPMVLAPGEYALRLVAIFDHDDRRTDDEFTLRRIGLLDHNVADEVRSARRRRLHVNERMLEPVDS